MSRVWAIASREFAAFFRLPVGWVVIALYLTLTGVVFALGVVRPGQPASLRAFFQISVWLLTFVAPAISMRLFSEEIRTGTLEPLMTAPVSDWHVVLGKYFGAVGFLVAMLAPTLIYVVTLAMLSTPDYGPMLAGYLGLLLLGLLYLAIGLVASSLTSNQILAFLGSLFFLLLMRALTTNGAQMVGPPVDTALYALSVDLRLAEFAKGVIDTSNVIFFLTASVWFLVIGVVSLESRRWR